MILVSLVIPCFNAIDKIGRCMASLERICFDPRQYEVIFVDDCSTDGTMDVIQERCARYDHWHFSQLEQNSGSPSRPRNRGIESAKGKYVYFLDCDDEILPGALTELCRVAEKSDACLVRSELYAEDGKQRTLMNSIESWHDALTQQERIRLIIQKQSTVANSLVRVDLLKRFDIRWPEHLRMGEDTVFLATVLAHASCVEYLPEPTFVYYKLPSLTPASTQRYGRRELRDHLEVWERVSDILSPLGIDYISTRLNVGLRVAIESLIFRSRRDIDSETFERFSGFVNRNWEVISGFRYTQRISDILQAINNKDYRDFSQLARPRLLIAGHDLKFIADATKELSEYFDIRFDEWSGHASHDETFSRECLNWAEYIWCEWLLGNAEWYVQHKRPDQRLVIRMHRMELGRVHGEKLDMDKVDAVIAVSPFFLERLVERFPNIPKSKARLIYNYVRISEYDRDWHPDRLFTLGIIGILPSRKGFRGALEILNELRKHDDRFNLKVFGKKAEDLSWIVKDPEEMRYFSECSQYISAQGLDAVVHYIGHVDIKKSLAQEKIGYVLSVSEPDMGFPGPESFHLAIADGFAGGGVSLISQWPGCEYIWPNSAIMLDRHQMVNKILALQKNPAMFSDLSREGRHFIQKHYDVDNFVSSIRELFLEVH